ncbi:MAG: HDIG domain-containing metalloprotein [Actinomycetota bacterium]
MPSVPDVDASAGVMVAARERLCDVLVRPDPSDGLIAMVADGFFQRWIPEVVEMQMEQDPVHRHKDVLTHTIAVTASAPPQLRLRCAALMHDIGKPATHRIGPKGVTFRHHEAVGARITRRRLTEMGVDDDFVHDVARLVELSGRFKGFGSGWTDSAVRRYVVDAGALLGDLNLLVRHDCTTRNASKAARLQRLVDELETRIRELAAADAEARRRPVLSGDEIMELLDIPPGPAVGEAVRLLLDHDPPLDASSAERVLRDWWRRRAHRHENGASEVC